MGCEIIQLPLITMIKYKKKLANESVVVKFRLLFM
jgi:hypothetical protein